MGPIGIENSELINLEVENEFKKKNSHVLKLNGASDLDVPEDAYGYVDEQGVYHGRDQDAKLFEENERLLQRLQKATANDNSKLIKSIDIESGVQAADPTGNQTNILNITNNQYGIGVESQSQESQSQLPNESQNHLLQQNVSKSNLQSIGKLTGEKSLAAIALQRQQAAPKISHDEWVRRKDHETQLRAKLILEAKRDLLETLVEK